MELKYFIYGMCSIIGIYYLTQIADNFMNLFASWITVRTNYTQKEINELFAETEVKSPQIGYVVQPEEEYYEDEEEYEDKAKAGFIKN